MRDVQRTYEAFHLACGPCDSSWRVVYEVTRWQDAGTTFARYAREGVSIGSPWHEERCPRCGAGAVVVSPGAAIPSPREARGRADPVTPAPRAEPSGDPVRPTPG